MKGVLVLKMLRQIHFTKKFFRGLTSTANNSDAHFESKDEGEEDGEIFNLDGDSDEYHFVIDHEFIKLDKNDLLFDENGTNLTDVETYYDSCTDDDMMIISPMNDVQY